MELDGYVTKATGSKNGLQLVIDTTCTDSEISGLLVSMSLETARVHLTIDPTAGKEGGKTLIMRAAADLTMPLESLLSVHGDLDAWRRLMYCLQGSKNWSVEDTERVESAVEELIEERGGE